MENAGGFLLILLIAGGVAAWLIARQRTRQARQRIEKESEEELLPDVSRPTPQLLDFHIRGEEALVTFAVPLPPGDVDDVLRDLLVHEAVEVVREKRHHLPIDGVTTVVALAGEGGEPRRVGEMSLEEPGVLPPPVGMPSMINLTHIGYDPMEGQFEEDMQRPPGLAQQELTDELPPIGQELALPTAVDVGLRTLGVDPGTMTSEELVTSLLQMFEYRVSPGENNTYMAEKGGVKTFIRAVPHEPGGHPELDSESIQQFVVEFQTVATDRGLLVSDKFSPFEVYEREQRDPRIRFVTRERLQKFIDSMALG